jgi:hypothetical protein
MSLSLDLHFAEEMPLDDLIAVLYGTDLVEVAEMVQRHERELDNNTLTFTFYTTAWIKRLRTKIEFRERIKTLICEKMDVDLILETSEYEERD